MPSYLTMLCELTSPASGVDTAHLVCKEKGYDFVEYNASDHRSALSLKWASRLRK